MTVKRHLATVLREIIGPIRERGKSLKRDPDQVLEVLRSGTAPARDVTAATTQTQYLSMVPATARNELIAKARRVARACVTQNIPDLHVTGAFGTRHPRTRSDARIENELDQGLNLDAGAVRPGMKRLLRQ